MAGLVHKFLIRELGSFAFGVNDAGFELAGAHGLHDMRSA